MIVNEMTFKLAGEAGQGVESNGAGLTKALARAGLYVVGVSDYMSRIRGGHNSLQIRVGENPLWIHNDQVHLLMAFDKESIPEHQDEIVPGGAVIYDEGLRIDTSGFASRSIQAFPMPLVKIAEEVGGNKIMMNTAAIGAACAVTGFDLKYVNSVIEDNFGSKKGKAIAEANLKVAQAAYDYAGEHYADKFQWKVEAKPGPERLVMHGNEALAMGALAGGCRFISAYPMTPASSILEWLTSHANRFNVVSKQTEDELSAILMALGASFTGARAMTATSGGGFCLMVEAIGLSGMTEVPVVVVDAQRPGPSTGMPTRTDQGDLLFAINASHGDFPKIVLAPGTIEECFEAGARAFNLAEKYQCPVIVMTDLHQSAALRSIDRDGIDFDAVKIDRGEVVTPEQLDAMEERYARYRITESGISPRAMPGSHPKAVYTSPSDEHDEYGNFDSETAENRLKMVAKRNRKIETALREMRGPQVYGASDADITFICWGGSYGAVRESVDLLNDRGERANLVHFTDMWPFPADKAIAALEGARYTVSVESNISAQFTRLLRGETGIQPDATILRYDGRSLTADYILANLKEVKISDRRQAV